MASSNPLGEKYARFRALNPSTIRGHSPMRLLSPAKTRNLSRKYDEYLRSRPSVPRLAEVDGGLRNRKLDSPIKLLREPAASAGRIPRLNRGLSPPKRSWEKPEVLGITKNRSWAEKKERARRESTPGRESVFLKLRSFLAKMGPSEDLQYKQLNESAGLARHEVPVETPRRHVAIDQSLFQRRYPSWDRGNEIDEVDEEVRRAKAREEVKTLKDRIVELELLLLQRQNSTADLKEELERKLYVATQDHLATVHTLKQELEDLQFRASRRYKELERQKVKELRDEVLRENESFLMQQNARDQHLKRREESLEEKALELEKKQIELDAKRIELEKREIDIQLKEEYLQVAEARLKARQLEQAATATKSPLEYVEAKLRENDADLKKFREIVNAVIEDTKGYKDHNLQFRLHKLIEPLSPTEDTRPSKWEALFEDYGVYFQAFDPKMDEKQRMENYNQNALKKIETSFHQLQKEFKEKIEKRSLRIHHLDRQIKRSWVRRYDFDIVKAERIAQYLKTRASLCHKQKADHEILSKFAQLDSSLKSIQASME